MQGCTNVSSTKHAVPASTGNPVNSSPFGSSLSSPSRASGRDFRQASTPREKTIEAYASRTCDRSCFSLTSAKVTTTGNLPRGVRMKGIFVGESPAKGSQAMRRPLGTCKSPHGTVHRKQGPRCIWIVVSFCSAPHGSVLGQTRLRAGSRPRSQEEMLILVRGYGSHHGMRARAPHLSGRRR